MKQKQIRYYVFGIFISMIKKDLLKIFTCVLLPGLVNTCLAQSVKVISNEDKQPLSLVNVSLNELNIGATDNTGTFMVSGRKGMLGFSHLGYITQLIPAPQRDTTILLLPTQILLTEVIIHPPQQHILGYFGPWGNGVIQGNADRNAVVNTITITAATHLKSFLFYIPKYTGSQINVPFEFVIFKEINGKYATQPGFLPVKISQYEHEWNSFFTGCI